VGSGLFASARSTQEGFGTLPRRIDLAAHRDSSAVPPVARLSLNRVFPFGFLNNWHSVRVSLQDLKSLVLSHQPLLVLDTVEEARAIDLIRRVSDQLLLPVFEWSLTSGLCRSADGQCVDGRTSQPHLALQHVLSVEPPGLYVLKDLDTHLSDPAVTRLLRDVCARFRQSTSTLVLLGPQPELPSKLRHEAVRVDVQLPGERELDRLLNETLRTLAERETFEAQLDAESRDALLSSLQGLTVNQARQAVVRAILEDGRLDPSDVRRVQQHKADLLCDGGLLEFHAPDEEPGELGGFDNLTAWLERARLGFSERARSLNLQAPRGILLTGVQGCGKSLAAKVIARSWKQPLLKLDAGRLFDKYIGESEKNFRKATALAETMAPCVLWIDEMEKAFATGNDASTDGGTSQRMLGSFLTWLQEKEDGVFLVATANEIDRLPPELLRKGRFDEIFFVDLPSSAERAGIFAIHLRRRNQDPDAFDLETLARITERFSGAEIEQAIIAGLYRALERNLPLNTDLLREEIGLTVPLAISRREDLERLRSFARERFVPVAGNGEPDVLLTS